MKYIKTLALLFVVMSLATGCKDDSDDHPIDEASGPEEEDVIDPEEQRVSNERNGVMTLLYNLADVEFGKDIKDDIDFESQTYEPTIGLDRDPANPLVRSVKVQDASYCESIFRSLVDDATFIRETDDGCIIDMSNLNCRADGKKQNLGTLTFHRGNGSDNVGYADVNIRCIPKLQRIVYLTQEQWGENASWDSPCEWGDVYLGNNHYWICVRESQGYNKQKKELRGVLVNIQKGRGDLYYSGYSEVWDANPVPKVQDIYDYLSLCGDEEFLTQKKRICKKLPNKIFPRLGWNKETDYVIFDIGSDDAGFATTEPGYIFNDSGTESKLTPKVAGVVMESKDTNPKFPEAHIFYAYYRDGYTAFKGNKRHQKYVSIPSKCKYVDEAESRDYDSWGDGGFRNLRRQAYPYTLSAVYFWDKVPPGFTLVDI